MKTWIVKYKTWLIIGVIVTGVASIVWYNKYQKDLADTGGLEPNFEISGKISGVPGLTLFIEAPSDKGTIPVAEGQINDDGSFSIIGNIPGLGYYFLRLGDEKNSLIPITLIPGDHLTINTSGNSFVSKPNAGGTSWSRTMNRYLGEFDKFQQTQARLQLNQENRSKEEVSKLFLAAKSKMEDFSRTNMMKDPSNAYNIILSMDLLPSVSFDD
jgi:hypothetical protein